MRDLFAPASQGAARVRVFDWPGHLWPMAIGSYEGTAPEPLPSLLPMGWTTIRPKCEAPRVLR